MALCVEKNSVGYRHHCTRKSLRLITERKEPVQFLARRLNDYNNTMLQSCKYVNLTARELNVCFQTIKCFTHVTKLKNFQYRLLHNAIHANDNIYHWKVVDSQLCNICLKQKQTVPHLFFECSVAKAIWKQFIQFLDACTNVDTKTIKISWKTVFCNSVHPKPKNLINLLVLIIKQYLYACKCLNRLPRFYEIVNKFELMFQTARYQAHVKGQERVFREKWDPFF